MQALTLLVVLAQAASPAPAAAPGPIPILDSTAGLLLAVAAVLTQVVLLLTVVRGQRQSADRTAALATKLDENTTATNDVKSTTGEIAKHVSDIKSGVESGNASAVAKELGEIKGKLEAGG